MAQHRTDKSQDEQRQLDRTRRDLVTEFAGRVPEAEITARFEEIVRSFSDAPVRGFVPVLVGRAARERLRSLAG